MTLWASREPGTDVIRIQVTHGPVTVISDEPEEAVRHLWGELGKLLEGQAPAPGQGF